VVRGNRGHKIMGLIDDPEFESVESTQRRNYPIRVIRVNPGAAFGRVVYRLRRQKPFSLVRRVGGHILTTHTHPSVNDFRAVYVG